MDLLSVEIIIGIIHSLALIGTWVWLAITSRSSANKSSIDALTKMMQVMDKRLIKVERDLERAENTSQELKVIHQRVDELAESHNQLLGKVAESNNTLGRIHQYLLDQKQ